MQECNPPSNNWLRLIVTAPPNRTDRIPRRRHTQAPGTNHHSDPLEQCRNGNQDLAASRHPWPERSFCKLARTAGVRYCSFSFQTMSLRLS
jgi:hypothetical protein